VPSGPIALELWKSSRGIGASAGRYWGRDVSKRRKTVAWRGPACGLRPVCCASCWYIGLPGAATGAADAGRAGAAEGDGAAAAAGEGDGPAAALAAGEAAAAGCGLAAVGAEVGDGVGVVLPLHAASKPLPLTTTATLAVVSKRRRLMCIQVAA
jgi:hypothetical protein